MEWWIVVVVSILVVGLLIYGIATHKLFRYLKGQLEDEVGMLGELKFTSDWVPLTLIVDTSISALEDHIIDAVKEAAAWWQDETSRRYFVPPGEIAVGGHVIPILEAPEDTERDKDRVLAYVELRVDQKGYLASAAVYLMPSWRGQTHATLVQAFKHELGHCLGLAHDGDVRSIMWHKVGERSQFVSPNDVSLLEELYPELSGKGA